MSTYLVLKHHKKLNTELFLNHAINERFSLQSWLQSYACHEKLPYADAFHATGGKAYRRNQIKTLQIHSFCSELTVRHTAKPCAEEVVDVALFFF